MPKKKKKKPLTIDLGSTELTINDEVITITGPTTLSVTDECTIDYLTTLENQSTSNASSVITEPIVSVQTGSSFTTPATNATVIVANGADTLLGGTALAVAGIAVIIGIM